MSYDVEIYAVSRPEGHSSITAARWQIAVHGPFLLEPEDIPSQVRAVLRGIQYRLDLHLEGAAPDSAYARLRAFAKRIAKQSRGVVVDQQKGTLETPRGVQRLDIDDLATDNDDDGILELSWFFMDTTSFTRAGLNAMIDVMASTLREALPRRYDLCEPPQHRLDREGMEHFKAFVAQHLREGIVWYCTKPCEHVFVSVPDHVGPTNRGFRCARVSLELSARTLRDPGWATELGRFWRAVAEILSPFYAEIRLGECPTSSWWWNGVPTEPALATLLGPPYVALWPAFAEVANHTSNGLSFINSLTDQGLQGGTIPSVPENIAQPSDRRIERDPITGDILSVFVFSDLKYPSVWPFDGPRAGPV